MQLALGLDLPPRYGPDDFLVAPCNEAAHAAILAWPSWPDPVHVLVGPPGAGKTHLAHVFAARSGAQFIDAAALAGGAVPATDALVFDDADRSAAGEEPFFHLLNRVRERRTALLLTGRAPVAHWPLALPDLRSRLRLAPAVEIGAPDDDLIRAVLVKSFGDRQVIVEANLIDYLVVRIERSFEAVRGIVMRLDAASLGAGRPITRALAAEVLRNDEAAQGPAPSSL